MLYEIQSFPLVADTCRNWCSPACFGRIVLSLSIWKSFCLCFLSMDGVLLSRMWSALFSMVHGDFLAALHYNAFFLLAFPFVAYYLIKQYIRFVFRKDPLPFFQIGLSAYNGIMLLVLLFWVLRNIPVFPFSLLAP